MKVVLSGNDEFVDLYPTHETDGVDIDGCEIPFVYAAYLINLGLEAAADLAVNKLVVGGKCPPEQLEGFAIGVEATEDALAEQIRTRLNALQVLRQAAEKGE